MKREKEDVKIYKHFKEVLLHKGNRSNIISLDALKDTLGYYFHIPKDMRADIVKELIHFGVIEPYPIKGMRWFNFKILD
jgi:predicted phosphatase